MEMEGLPVVLGSSATGILVSLALSREGIDHVLIGSDEPPAPIPRLGESLIDTSSPELWRLYGQEFAQYFHYKNHISYLNGHFSSLAHLASPTRSRKRIDRFAPKEGKARYPWFGEALFHLDRIGFDRAAWDKARAQSQCHFVRKRVARLVCEADAIQRIEFEDGTALERPKYVFDATGFQSLVGKAVKIGTKPVSTPQRVVWTHYRRKPSDPNTDQWWRGGTNILRLDKEFDGIDAFSWAIPLGETFSVGLSVDQNNERADDDDESLMARLESAYRRRGVDFQTVFSDRQPIQQLRHTYFVRDRAWGKNWLLVGPTFITIWFPGSTGLWTVCAAAGMCKRLIEKPELGAFYERSMKQLLHFHYLLDEVAHGPIWKSSFQVYHFFGKGGALIWSRLSDYLRIRDDDYGWFRPSAWLLHALEKLGRNFPPFMVVFFVFALLRSRLDVERSVQGRPFPFYLSSITFRVWNILRGIPFMLWAAVPRRTLPPGPEGPAPIASTFPEIS